MEQSKIYALVCRREIRVDVMSSDDTADEWLETQIVFFGMFVILCIFLLPWLFFADGPLGTGWSGRARTTIVRHLPAVPAEPAQQPSKKSIAMPRSTQVSLFLDLSQLEADRDEIVGLVDN